MTRVTALRAMEKAVDAGAWDQVNAWKVFGVGQTGRAERAYNGSLDAAKALHDAVLPGWVASIDTDGFARVYWPGPVITVMETVRLDGAPARAWLLAIIRALIAKEATE